MLLETAADMVQTIVQGNMSEASDLATAYIRVTDSRDISGSVSALVSASNALNILPKAVGNVLGKVNGIPVQFNPSTLKFASSHVTKENQDAKTSGVLKDENKDKQQGKATLEINAYVVSMRLVFDKSDKTSAGVKPEVETFLAMVQNRYLNQISFNWGAMHFAGSLESVAAEYVMFNETGMAVRANVELKIKVTEK